MEITVKKIFIALLFLMANFEMKAQVREIQDPNINDIAITTILNGQVVILYNPIYCQQLGLLICNFFRAHEYGHVNMRHPILGTHPQQAEFEADCWAARNAPLSEVRAAMVHFFENGAMGNWSHGTGFQRAQRIELCSRSRPDLAPPRRSVESKDDEDEEKY